MYPILDREVLDRCGHDMLVAATELCAAGCTLLQFRDKVSPPAEVLARAKHLRAELPVACRLVLNDRVDLAMLAGIDGVHVGQTDLPPAEARALLGPAALVGYSTHTAEQFRRAAAEPVDYIAVGPVFATSTKADAEPAVGLALLREVRAASAKPIVAIGGITPGNVRRVLAAGADSVAVISSLFLPGQRVADTARALLDEMDIDSSRA